MKLAVFGATGATGRLLTWQALEAGHEVVAYARCPEKLMGDARLSVVEGQLSNLQGIEETVCGADAVVSLLGPRSAPHGGTPIADATCHIVQAMAKHGVRRLVAVGTPSVSDVGDVYDWRFRLLLGVVRWGASSAYHDLRATGEVVRASEVDWTLVRVPLLTNSERLHHVQAGRLGPRSGLLLSRTNLVDFILRQVECRAWLRRAPVVSDTLWL